MQTAVPVLLAIVTFVIFAAMLVPGIIAPDTAGDFNLGLGLGILMGGLALAVLVSYIGERREDKQRHDQWIRKARERMDRTSRNYGADSEDGVTVSLKEQRKSDRQRPLQRGVVRCYSCDEIVVPRKRISPIIIVLFLAGILPALFYLMGAPKRCPNCNAKL